MWLLKSSHKHIGRGTLSEYLDGRLQGRDLERVEQRLEECDACRNDLAELRAVVAMMQQLPMEAPRRSFVMTAPPLGAARAKPAFALRAPNWVYAGAASMAVLAFTVTVLVDSSGQLLDDSSMEQQRLESAVQSPEQTADAFESVAASRPAGTPEAAMAAAAEAPTMGPGGQAGQAESAAPPALSMDPEVAPLGTPGPETADRTMSFATGVLMPTPSQPVGGAGGSDGATSESQPGDAETAKSLPATAEAPILAPSPVPGPSEAALIEQDDRSTRVWWLVSESVLAALAAAFLAGLLLRWRAIRRDTN